MQKLLQTRAFHGPKDPPLLQDYMGNGPENFDFKGVFWCSHLELDEECNLHKHCSDMYIDIVQSLHSIIPYILCSVTVRATFQPGSQLLYYHYTRLIGLCLVCLKLHLYIFSEVLNTLYLIYYSLKKHCMPIGQLLILIIRFNIHSQLTI